MPYLWAIAGAIIGWVFMELLACLVRWHTGGSAPMAFNFGMAFVGALAGYALAVPC